MKNLGIIDLSHDKSSIGTDICFFKEVFPSISFFKFFLNRVSQIEGLDKVVAIVHHNLISKVERELISFPDIDFYPIPEGNKVRHYLDQNIIESSRKWGYRSLRGGAYETSFYDELLPMEIIKQIAEQIDAESILYLNPEMPLFDLEYTHQIMNAESKGEKTPPFYIRQTVQGLCPLFITETGLKEFKKNNWSARVVLKTHPGGDGLTILHKYIENSTIDLSRGSFLLRCKNDFEHLTWVLNRLAEKEKPFNAENLILESKEYDHSISMEVDIECSSESFSHSTRLPQDIPDYHIDINIFNKVYNEICDWETGRLSIGDLTDTLGHPMVDEIKEILKSKKPYGLHIILNVEKIIKNQDLMDWFTIPMDILTLRVTSLCYSLFNSIDDLSDILEYLKNQFNNNKLNFPAVNLELHKNEDNIYDIHKIAELADRYGVSYNWIPYNDYCGQLETSEIIQSLPNNRYPCEKLLNQMYILSNGNVSSCKQDYKGKQTWGNVHENSLAEIWNSEAYVKARKEQISGIYDQTTPLCKNCQRWNHT